MDMDELDIIEERVEGDIDAHDENNENQRSKWPREDVERFDSTSQSLEFQWLEIAMATGDPWFKNPDNGKIMGSNTGPVPIIRLYGVTSEGTSVMTTIHGFTPYFYVEIRSVEITDTFLAALRVALDVKVSHYNIILEPCELYFSFRQKIDAEAKKRS
jgi:hypothetical protein